MDIHFIVDYHDKEFDLCVIEVCLFDAIKEKKHPDHGKLAPEDRTNTTSLYQFPYNQKKLDLGWYKRAESLLFHGCICRKSSVCAGPAVPSTASYTS